jgi:ribosomal protein L13E
MWSRNDWRDFFRIAGRRIHKYRPPRPVDLSGQGRLIPTTGFSLRELDAAGISIMQAQELDLPVDAGRVSEHRANVAALRDFARAARGGS